jgi:hypothetical protein
VSLLRRRRQSDPTDRSVASVTVQCPACQASVHVPLIVRSMCVSNAGLTVSVEPIPNHACPRFEAA